MADDFAFRFSSKYYDPETGFYNYGHRYYDPVLGRWISKDLSGVKGGLNEVGFVNNDAINNFDVLGKAAYRWENYQWDPHFNKMKIKLTIEMEARCPDSDKYWTYKGNKYCCPAKQCKEQAKNYASLYVDRLKSVFMSNLVKNGPVSGGLKGNARAGSVCDQNVGDKYADWENGNGLKCGGWTELAAKTFQDTLASKSNRNTNSKRCWFGDAIERRRHWYTIKHAFYTLSAPNGTITLDPWPSGGSDY